MEFEATSGGARTGGDSSRGSKRSNAPLLPIYLREMGATRLLTQEKEVELASQLQQAREEFCQLVTRLPADLKSYALEGDRTGPGRGRLWPLEKLESCYRRILRYEDQHGQARTSELVSEARRSKARVDRARDALILANLRLVTHIAKRYVNQGMPFMDLIQEGNIGLMKAVEKFDHTRGYKFSTYAYWWIKQAMTRAIADRARLIRIPVHLSETLKRMKRAAEKLGDTLGREPTPDELADEMGLPLKKILEILEIVQEPQPLEMAVNEEGMPGLLPFVADSKAPDPHDKTLRGEVREAMRGAMVQLDDREREIISLRFGIGDGDEVCHTLEAIGKVVNLSRERVRQIEGIALRKIRMARRASGTRKRVATRG